ncbi:hypothetical protein E2562_004519 [Oryza meyeriana var. granulata]|uniref:Uncharacterized protein n=1 Tax=Oryza meyeriana var. granulata TaxID=110450 RepID=A0A6G1F3C3_9ORYZ|nr:hypothetical protein E2562_004519 [Oryza meyeriana var. granulata]
MSKNLRKPSAACGNDASDQGRMVHTAPLVSRWATLGEGHVYAGQQKGVGGAAAVGNAGVVQTLSQLIWSTCDGGRFDRLKKKMAPSIISSLSISITGTIKPHDVSTGEMTTFLAWQERAPTPALG